MIPDTLNTNEIKNAAGAEVEFQLLEQLPGRGKVFHKVGEAPNLLDRLSVRHQELSSGVNQRRRSALQTTLEVAGVSGVERKIVFTTTADIPIGDIADFTEVKNAAARHMSFLASRGATTTILYDCTGYGAEALVNGSL